MMPTKNASTARMSIGDSGVCGESVEVSKAMVETSTTGATVPLITESNLRCEDRFAMMLFSSSKFLTTSWQAKLITANVPEKI